MVKYLLHAYHLNLQCVLVLCFCVWQITKWGYFSKRSCAVGDESSQEYTQLNAFLLCVSDFVRQWGQWRPLVTTGPNSFSLTRESQSGSHKWALPHSLGHFKIAGRKKENCSDGGGGGDSLRWFLSWGQWKMCRVFLLINTYTLVNIMFSVPHIINSWILKTGSNVSGCSSV